MKNILRQKAKSALSILLTLCMILSVVSVGITSIGAANVDVAGSGRNVTANKAFFLNAPGWSNVYMGFQQQEWGSVDYTKMAQVAGTQIYYRAYNYDNYHAFVFASSSSGDNVGTYYMEDVSNTKFWDGPSASGSTSMGNMSGKAKVITKVFNGTNYVAAANTNCVARISGKKLSNTYISTADTSASTGAADNAEITVAYGSTITYTATSNANYVFKGFSTTNSSNLPGSLNATGYTRTSEAYTGNDSKAHTNSVVYAYFDVANLDKPSIEFDSSSINAGTSAVLNITNHPTISGKDSNVSYELYKGSSKMTSGYEYSNGKFTLTDTTASSDATYYVIAKSSNLSNYRDSAKSSGAKLTVYEPMYCIVGDDVEDAYLDQSGNLIGHDVPAGDKTYFNTWQENLKIATPVSDHPGKYSFTFKVNENSTHSNINLCIAAKNGSAADQKGYIYNDEPYNTASNDLVIPDEGIASGLYAYNMPATNAGGSLVLKKGQTYTIIIDQTKRYQDNASNPVGEITITATDAFVNTAAKKMAYNPTNRGWDDVSDAAAIIGSASASPIHGTKTGFTSTLTAVVANNSYEFVGWYTSPECTGTPDIAASACDWPMIDTYTYDLTNITKTVDYYALFKQKQPTDHNITVTQPANTDGSFVITSGAAATSATQDNTTAYPGAVVGLEATPENGKELAYWKITNTLSGQDVTTQVMANRNQATSSFSMPPYDVAVTAVFRNRTQATINTSVNIPGLGTVAITQAEPYYVGDTVDITATNTDGVFKNWTVTGGSIDKLNNKTAKLTISSSTVNVKAVFDYKTYQLYYNGKNLPMVRQSDGSYVSTFKIPGSSKKFTVYNASDGKYANANADTNNSYNFTSSLKTASVYQDDTANANAWKTSAPTTESQYITQDSITGYLVFYPPGSTVDSAVRNNGYLKLVDTNPLGDIAQIYAKDGSIRYKNSGSSSGELFSSGGEQTCLKGVTTVTSINSNAVSNPDSSKYPDSTTNKDHLKIYSAPIGSTITIQTKMNAAYNTKGFYVGMFVINGWKVAASKTGTDTYTANYTLTDAVALNDTSSNKSFEITPVYYNKYFDYVTFYVDAASVPTSTWGQTISTEAYYQGATNSHFEGSYPGQPLGREGDMYEIKVAKCYYEYSASTAANGGWTAQTNRVPSATITSYMYDVVHHFYYVANNNNLDSEAKNYQTYDYSDFAWLAQIKDLEAIMFRCKVTNNDNRLNIDSNTYPTTSRTYELLTDYYGNPIDALGNRLTKPGGSYYTAAELDEDDAQVKVISAGNCNTEGLEKQRTKGKWATYYMAYDLSDNKAISLRSTPADYINYNINTPEAADTSTLEFKLANGTSDSGKSRDDLRNKITYISYDQERTNTISSVGDTGHRIDGRWYFSAQSEFYSNVKVAIKDNASGAIPNVKVDGVDAKIDIEADSNSANNTGYVGATSKTTASLDDQTTHMYKSVNTEASLKASVGNGYTFVGWYLYDDVAKTYTKIHDNYLDTATTMTMKKSYTIVAVVQAVPEGSLVITHSKFTGDNPEPAHDGSGKYYVSATVYNSDNTVKREYDEALNSLAIEQLTPSDKLKITLHTICNGDDLFYAWYEEGLDYDNEYARTGRYYEICSEDTDPKDEKEVSYTFFTADCSNFFNDNKLVRSSLDFYSDILHKSAKSNITYKYYDRFSVNGKGQMVSYTVKGVELDYDEIAAGYIPSDKKIAKYAPDVIDTIFSDTRWVITDLDNKVQRSMSNVTVVATQTEKDCFVQYLTPEAIQEDLVDNSGNILPKEDLQAYWTNTSTAYNDWALKPEAKSTSDNWDYEDFLVRAPESFTKDGTTYTFQRFDVYRVTNRQTDTFGDLIYSCNDNVFGYRIFTDCVIYPVYTTSQVTKELTATIEPAVLNREVWGTSTNITDRLYADLVIASINADLVDNKIPAAVKENNPSESGYKIETGLIVDRAKILADNDYNTLHDAAVNGSPDTTKDILSASKYTDVFKTTNEFDTLLKNDALDENNTVIQKQINATYNDTNSAKHTLIKYVNDNDALTSKNRIDKVLQFNNSDAARRYVFAAYSYVVIRRADGSFVQAAISSPQYFSFCYLGNQPIETDLSAA